MECFQREDSLKKQIENIKKTRLMPELLSPSETQSIFNSVLKRTRTPMKEKQLNSNNN